ncbi:quinone oxidoreductase [Caulobacter sp. UNC279MFTsu5.1]|uniref:quinone oxidoreductase family protein n=1 Tax=Caulobacter sp. UNC279MFTsu5.1 TaxID=1502775 RepID=UPI00036104BF|nr:quinone oxidoreductase [Caulobacter sp. UNC279MFTsu5.1]SFJ80963.1 NADPH2:quinone reductase [Caulobacter sp. UNC279MFTsu5.1]
MIRSIELVAPGGVDQLQLTRRPLPPPGDGELRVRHHAAGVNFIDVYYRTGLYPLPLPGVLGVEGAGVVEAVGTGVEDVAVGDRIAYAGAPLGGYAEVRNLPATRATKLPDGVDTRLAAGAMLRGLTVQMLLRGPRPPAPGSTLLVHAAAGGLGQLLTRWAARLDLTVIGTASSEAKARVAREAGAAHVIIGRDADFVAQTLDLTDGRGVDVAYDGLGGAYLRKTFDAVTPFGMVVNVGQAAGAAPPVLVTDLSKRALALWRPSVMAYVADVPRYRSAAADLLGALERGDLTVEIGGSYALEDAGKAQADLEAGRTTGSLLLIP